MKTMVETMADMVAIPAGDVDDMGKIQDKIYAKHSGELDALRREAVAAVKDATFQWKAEAMFDDYYHNRRRLEREYVGALNATARIERFLSK